MDYESRLLDAIGLSYSNYIEFGARSNKKLIPLHHEITSIMMDIFGSEYQFFSYDHHGELKVVGKYYDKDIDITVVKGSQIVCCVGVKFITSNYKQNANNYFENMMGETANIQANNIPYYHIIVLRHETPYYKKTSQATGLKTASKIEEITQKDLQKYLNLTMDVQHAHKPKGIGLFLVDIDEQEGTIRPTNMSLCFEPDFLYLFNQNMSILKLFSDIENYKNFIERNNG